MIDLERSRFIRPTLARQSFPRRGRRIAHLSFLGRDRFISIAIGILVFAAVSSVATAQTLPVTIIQQPLSLAVNPGTNATFGVVATGTPPLTYQWLFDGSPIAGTNLETLIVSNVTAAASGGYSVVVSNILGPVTSAVATLAVNTPITITTQPQSLTVNPGTNVIFNVLATGTAPIAYQWLFNGSPIAGATASVLTLNNVSAANAGSYAVVLSNIVGSITNPAASLALNTPITITQQPLSLTVNSGTNATFNVQASGTGPITYQWIFNDRPIVGAIAKTLVILNLNDTCAGNYSVVVSNIVGSVTSAVAVLAVNTPITITQQPQSLAVNPGTNATFTALAAGTAPITYQWLFNGNPIAGTTTTALILTNVSAANAGNYAVVLSNIVGAVTSAVAALAVNTPITITQQPLSLTVNPGTNVIFNVLATGTSPITYQWLFNGNPITGATASALTLNNVSAANAGNYAVVLSNIVGAVTSSNALFRVSPPSSVSISNPTLMETILTFSIPTEIGYSYLLEYADGISDINWRVLQSVPGTGQQTTFAEDVTGLTGRIYRIEIR